jgi:hypothetical protein
MASHDQSGENPHAAPGHGGATKNSGHAGADRRARAHNRVPDWAGGLKQLYDSVVEEPLPDAFKDLLDRLDQGASSSSGGTSAAGGSGDAR